MTNFDEQAQKQVQTLWRGEPVYWQAHRGGGAYEAPDNTMAANRFAWSLGGIPEADLRATRDGVIVCLHDATMARTTDCPPQLGDIPVERLAFAQLREWDAGRRFDPKFAGERIPAVEELFAEMRGHAWRRAYLDLKQIDLAALGRLIKQYEVNRQVIFTHREQQNCEMMRQLAPGVATMLWIGGSAAQIERKFREAAATGFRGLDQVQLHLNDGTEAEQSWPYDVSLAFVAEALRQTREAGIDLEVLPFSLHKGAIGSLLELGIRWYATDEPTKFLQCVAHSDRSHRLA